MNYELRELHEFKSGQTYINLVDFFTVNCQPTFAKASAGMAVNFLFPPPRPLFRTTNFAPDYNFGAEKLRKFDVTFDVRSWKLCPP